MTSHRWLYLAGERRNRKDTESAHGIWRAVIKPQMGTRALPGTFLPALAFLFLLSKHLEPGTDFVPELLVFRFVPARHGFRGRARAEDAKEQKPPDGEDQKPREALWPSPRPLRVPSVCFAHTVLFWNQPTGLLSHTTQVAQTDPKLRSLLPSEAQPNLVSLFEDKEPKIGGKFQASGVYWG